MSEALRAPNTKRHLEELQRLARVEVEDGSLVAKVFSMCMVLRGQEAKGR